MLTALSNRFSKSSNFNGLKKSFSTSTLDTGNLTSSSSSSSLGNSLDATLPTSPNSSSSLSIVSLEEGNLLLLQEPLVAPSSTTKQQSTVSWLDFLLDPSISRGRHSIPLQSQARPYLKYLIVAPLLSLASMTFFSLYWVPLLLNNGAFDYLEDQFDALLKNNTLTWVLLGLPIAASIVADLANEGTACLLLLRGRRRRQLPSNVPRLTHAVIICNYKEPLEVLRATIASLAHNTLAENTMVVLACEERDPTAAETYRALELEFSTKFKAFFCTSHKLMEGEVIGKSSNENYACQELYKVACQEYGLDPFQVMVTTCDADSLFDTVYLEQLEAEFCRMPDGRRFLYNAPINTYRNLPECNWLVRAFEVQRCHYESFAATSFRPTQSNYCLTLGMAHEINYWDPSNTSEDFHTTLKIMATTGKGDAAVVKVWSLILNDSVTSFHDRWIQAKRHMWGIEEVAFVASLFPVVRLPIWTAMMGRVVGQMFIGVCTPAFIYLAFAPVWRVFFSLRVETQCWMVGLIAAKIIYQWIKTILREMFLYRFILNDRELMMERSWGEWLQLILSFPLTSKIGSIIFSTLATWRMLIHAVFHETLAYVTAPKALSGSGGIPSIIHHQRDQQQPKKGDRKSVV